MKTKNESNRDRVPSLLPRSVVPPRVMFCLVAALAVAFPGKLFAASTEREVYYVPDVESQFRALALRPEALGFGINDSPNPSSCRHYQGLARKHGPGTPYLFITRSGNDPGIVPCPISDVEGPGNLLVVRLGSRNTTGERLRSNRLVRDWDINGLDPFATPSDPQDLVAAWFRFDGTGGWPKYKHPGGLQLVGDILAVPMETPYGATEQPDNLVAFFDVSNPEQPQYRSQYDPGSGSEFSAGLVGIAPLPSGRYLMLITGKKNEVVKLYRSKPTEPDGTTDLGSTSLDWEFLRSFSEGQIETCLGADWHTGMGDAHQMLNFVRQGGPTGPLYLIGGRNTTFLPSGDDYVDLYKVHVGDTGEPADCLLTHVASKHLTSKPIIGGGDSANFAAASGVYVSPSGELIVYSSEYENDGPLYYDGTAFQERIVRFGEWRHREMVRPGSPTYKPSVSILNGPYEVDEGSAITLQASAAGPITKAWLQLFEDDDLGASLPGLLDSDDWLVADYEDWGKDDFDDFRKLHYSDDAGSWRWFAPVGCTLRVNDDDFSDDNFPGKFTRTLHGTGQVEAEPDLNAVPNDQGDYSMDDEITSMQFFPDCDHYYGARMDVQWDLDGNSVFESDQPFFDASNLDGPAVVTIHARAKHPYDNTALGYSPIAAANVTIRNVPPTIESFAVRDALGNEIGVDVPFTLAHLEIFSEGAFTDPGKPDHQTASVDWNDGTIDLSASFDLFTDAFGGVTGQLKQSHIYDAANTYHVQCTVMDDDLGLNSQTVAVKVATPEEATESVIEAIDDLITSEADPDCLADLILAQADLRGNKSGMAYNGALDKLERNNLTAFLVKIKAALERLDDVRTAGCSDTTQVMYLLTTISESVTRDAYLLLVEAIGHPNRGEAKQLARMAQAIANGHQALVDGYYLVAIEWFKDAVGRQSAAAARVLDPDPQDPDNNGGLLPEDISGKIAPLQGRLQPQ